MSDIGGRWTPECQVGWWDMFVGPSKAIDTNHFFVICANILGSPYGTTSPLDPLPAGGVPLPSGSPFSMTWLTAP